MVLKLLLKLAASDVGIDLSQYDEGFVVTPPATAKERLGIAKNEPGISLISRSEVDGIGIAKIDFLSGFQATAKSIFLTKAGFVFQQIFVEAIRTAGGEDVTNRIAGVVPFGIHEGGGIEGGGLEGDVGLAN